MISLVSLKKEAIKPVATVRRRVNIQTKFGPADFVTFTHLNDSGEHVALVFKGLENEVPLVRIHSECLTGDVFGSARCDCGEQLEDAQRDMAARGGILLYLRQEGRGIGLYNKLDAYSLQDLGHDTFEANTLLGLPEDSRDFSVAAQMLKALDCRAVRLLTNNPEKAAQLRSFGVEVKEIQRTEVHINHHNRRYLEAKVIKGGHLIELRGLEENT